MRELLHPPDLARASRHGIFDAPRPLRSIDALPIVLGVLGLASERINDAILGLASERINDAIQARSSKEGLECGAIGAATYSFSA